MLAEPGPGRAAGDGWAVALETTITPESISRAGPGTWIGQQTLARSLAPGEGLDLAVAEPG